MGTRSPFGLETVGEVGVGIRLVGRGKGELSEMARGEVKEEREKD